ncbi:uncharacterized protein [Amphiura filiformis]|uniref:uncharacterized protein n=1 Tax=Amphiura filiformis TaxID=82378 RepID=UPI003B228A16
MADKNDTEKRQPLKCSSFKLSSGCEASIFHCDWTKHKPPPADVYVTAFLEADLKSDQICSLIPDSVRHDLERQIHQQSTEELCQVFGMPPGNFPCNRALYIIINGKLLSGPSAVADFKMAITKCISQVYQVQWLGARSIAFAVFREQWQYAFIIETVVEATVDLVSTQSLRDVMFIIDDMHEVDDITAIFRKKADSAVLQSIPYTRVYTMTNGPTIQVINDNIFHVVADAMIIAKDSDVDTVGEFCVSAGLFGGHIFQSQLSYLETVSTTIGSTFVLSGDGFLCSNVILTIVPSMKMNFKHVNTDHAQGLQLALANSLECAEKMNATTITLPAIGSTYTQLYEKACPILVDTLVKYFHENPSSTIKVIKFVDISMRMIQALTEALESNAVVKVSANDDYTDTPAEILSCGPVALKAYLKASQDGTKSVYRTRLMLVGQERVGKTSLMKTITGQRYDGIMYNQSEGITDGVDATTFVQVSPNKGNPWIVQETACTDFAKHVENQYIDTLSTLMVQQLKNLGNTLESEETRTDDQEVEQSISANPEADKTSQDKGQDFADGDQTNELSNMVVDDEESQQVPEGTISGADVQAHQTIVPETIAKKLLHQLQLTQDDHIAHQNVPEFQIWDFAGQDVYYTTHQVFLSNRAIYILAFDLRLDLSRPVKVQIANMDKLESRFHELTGLGFLDFWMQSIYAYAITKKQICDANKPQLSPPIFIVGTHRDSSDISIDPQERKSLIAAKFQIICDMVSGKPYEQHVVSRFYAIENSLNDQADTEVSFLREHIVSVASQETYMGEEIPLRWLKFEKSVAEAINEGQHFMKLAQVQAMSRDLGIQSDTELFTMLHFYHDLGTIIYFGGNDNNNRCLQEMVILDPQWLIDIFKRIITVLPWQQQWATLKTKWRRLKEEGILEECLIDHMWHDLLPQKPALLALMEMFDLLCPQTPTEKGEAVCTYYVPACLQPCAGGKMHQELAGNKSNVTFYIDLHGFLPDGLFHRLLVHAARWSQQQSGQTPHLFYRYGNFSLDNEHHFQLQMQTSKPVCIKVTVSKTPVISAGGMQDRSNIRDAQPDPKACTSVKSFLATALNELTLTWIHGIKYELSIGCPCNDLSAASDEYRCCHLLTLEDCLNESKVKCNEKQVWVDTEVFKTWFHSEMKCNMSKQDEATNAIIERPDGCLTEASNSGVLTTESTNGVQISKTRIYGNQLCPKRDNYNISGDLHIHVQEMDLNKDML